MNKRERKTSEMQKCPRQGIQSPLYDTFAIEVRSLGCERTALEVIA
jgi:hypothetical protein